MLAVLLGSASAVLSRGSDIFGFNIDAPRYVLLYRLAVAAFAWAMADALLGLGRIALPQLAVAVRNRLLCGAALAMLCIVVVIQVVAFGNIRERKSELSTEAGWSELALYMRGVDAANTFTLQGWLAGGNPPLVNGHVIAWIADRRVNVFSPGYRASPYLANYKRGRSAYEGQPQPVPLRVDANNCIEHPAFRGERAWNAQLDSPHDGRFSLLQEPGEPSYFIRSGFQNVYGILPPGKLLRACFPPGVTVRSFSHLPVPGT
jgi:hypothetical protein